MFPISWLLKPVPLREELTDPFWNHTQPSRARRNARSAQSICKLFQLIHLMLGWLTQQRMARRTHSPRHRHSETSLLPLPSSDLLLLACLPLLHKETVQISLVQNQQLTQRVKITWGSKVRGRGEWCSLYASLSFQYVKIYSIYQHGALHTHTHTLSQRQTKTFLPKIHEMK